MVSFFANSDTEYRYFVEYVKSNIHDMALPFFASSNIEMMEAIWVNHVRPSIRNRRYPHQKEPLNYFRNLKYGRGYCNRAYIALKKPFNTNQKFVQMNLALSSMVTLLNENKAEIVYETMGKEYDIYIISVCFGESFLVYKYYMYI